MKKFIAGLIIGLLVASTAVGMTSSDPVKIFVDGEEIFPDVPPRTIDGRVMVPARFIAEPLGAEVEWDGENRFVLIYSEIETKEREKEGMIPLREMIEKYGDEYGLTAGGDGYVYRNGETLFSWEEKGTVIDARVYVPEDIVEKYISMLEKNEFEQEPEPKPEPKPGPEQEQKQITGGLGETLDIEGLRIRIDDVKHSDVHTYDEDTEAGHIAPEGMKYAIVSFTIINENAKPDGWASVSNWNTDANESHSRYKEWLEEWSYRAATNRTEVSDWIYEGDKTSSEIRFRVFESMELTEIHYTGIQDVEVVFEIK